MAIRLFKGSVFTDGLDVSGQLSATNLSAAKDILDGTPINSSGRVRTAGLKSVAMSHQGYWASASTNDVDPVFFGALGVSNVPVTIAAGTSEGSIAYPFRAIHANYTPGAAVGELFGFGVTAEGDIDPGVTRGVLLRYSTSEGLASTTGTAFQLTESSSGKTLYGTLHVFSVTGGTTSLAVTVQSDGSSTFPSPTTVLTFTGTTASTSRWQSAALGSTDNWFRANITSSSGVVRAYAVAIGFSS